MFDAGGNVEFEDAKRIGDQGESLVAAELERLAPILGLTVLHDLVLSVGPMTAQFDHIIVDRFGVLIIESKVRSRALIKGSDKEKNWTACYPGGRTASFQNPLRQNEEHENLLRKALEQAGNELDPDYVKSAAVVMHADISQLKLDSISRDRVTDLTGVEPLLHRRHTFALNPGDLSTERVALLAGLLRGLDRSKDAAVMAHHADYRKDGRSFAVAPLPSPQQKAHSSSGLRRAPRAAASRSAALAALNRAPHATSLAGIGFRVVRRVLALMSGLAVLLLIAYFSWYFFIGPGLPAFTELLIPGEQITAPPSTAPTQLVSVERALQVLQETAPEKVAGLVNANDPLVTPVAQGTTYTWEHVSSAGSIAQAREISITLDASGNLVGANIE